MNIEFSESAGEIVGDTDVICVNKEIFEGKMEGEEGGGEEETEEEGMRCHCRPAQPNPPSFQYLPLFPFSEKTRLTTMKAFLALLFAPFALAATTHEKLLKLAQQGNGLIKLDPKSFDLLTSPKRTWSASIQLTALDKRRKCTPCRYVLYSFSTHPPYILQKGIRTSMECRRKRLVNRAPRPAR